ncbi:mCG146900 [Mus musculus]|nr:mCG146900 [Mus musculus]
MMVRLQEEGKPRWSATGKLIHGGKAQSLTISAIVSFRRMFESSHPLLPPLLSTMLQPPVAPPIASDVF